MSTIDLRALFAKAIYAEGTLPDWLTTVDGSPNAASYELADRALRAFGRAYDNIRDEVVTTITEELWRDDVQPNYDRVSALYDEATGALGMPNMYHGTCPKCRQYKFIGHGPLCVDCYTEAA